MTLRSSYREKKRYIVVKFIPDISNEKNIVEQINRIFGVYGLTKYGISIVKITKKYLIIRCKHNHVKEVISGLFFLKTESVPKCLKVTGTLRSAKSIAKEW